MKSKNAMRLVLAITALQTSAVAQVRFCIGGVLDHLPSTQRSACATKLQAVRRLATTLGAPDDWHFVLVCGEEGWTDYSIYAKGGPDRLADRSADTNLNERETFLREASLNSAELESSNGIIAHEVAAAVLGSKDEVAIRAEIARRPSATHSVEASSERRPTPEVAPGT